MFANGKRISQCVAILMLLVAMLVLSACGTVNEDTAEDDGVIEPGVEETQEEDAEETAEEEPFPDLGEAATVSDLSAALAKIDSYYFEQAMPYVDGSVYMQIWYKNNIMKIQTSVDGNLQQIAYYDYNALVSVSDYPGSGMAAMKAEFDPESADAPSNPVLLNYSAFTEQGFETIDRQTCMKLAAPDGNIYWVSTKYGFPMQVTFKDNLGEEYTVQYKNLSVNNVEDTDVAIPQDLMEN